MKSRIDSPVPGRLTRRTATVTISAPDASWASRMMSSVLYLPVPTISRDVNSLPPSTRLVSYMALASSHRPDDLHLVAFRERDGRIGALRGHLAVDGDGRVLSLDVEEGEQVVHGDPGLDVHRLAVDADLHRHERPLPSRGAAVLDLAAVFPSLELPRAGSRGPGPHPVLRNPPPTATTRSIPRGCVQGTSKSSRSVTRLCPRKRLESFLSAVNSGSSRLSARATYPALREGASESAQGGQAPSGWGGAGPARSCRSTFRSAPPGRSLP